MPYKPYESDGLNLLSLISDAGNNPGAEQQVPIQTNVVRALYNLNRKIDTGGGGGGSGDMTKAVYDPTSVAGDAFDMANMVEDANAKVLTSAERAAIAANALTRLVTLTSGEATTAGQIGYVKSDGKIWLTDASAEATSGPVLVGVILTTTAGADEACVLQISGVYSDAGLTPGAYYISTTGGAKTSTAPSATGEIARVLGYANSATEFLVSPDETWVEIGDGSNPISINTQTGTSYTLVLSDAGKYVRMNNAAANVLTVPLNASVAYAVGTHIDVRQEGAGLTTIRGASGVTLNRNTEAGGDESDVDSAGQDKAMSLVKISTDAWDVIGGA